MIRNRIRPEREWVVINSEDMMLFVDFDPDHPSTEHCPSWLRIVSKKSGETLIFDSGAAVFWFKQMLEVFHRVGIYGDKSIQILFDKASRENGLVISGEDVRYMSGD